MSQTKTDWHGIDLEESTHNTGIHTTKKHIRLVAINRIVKNGEAVFIVTKDDDALITVFHLTGKYYCQCIIDPSNDQHTINIDWKAVQTGILEPKLADEDWFIHQNTFLDRDEYPAHEDLELKLLEHLRLMLGDYGVENFITENPSEEE